MAAVRNEGVISIGNILGSNIFNLLFILGDKPSPRPGHNRVRVRHSRGRPLFSVAILPLIFARPGIVRGWSIVLLIGYAAYIAWIFATAPVA